MHDAIGAALGAREHADALALRGCPADVTLLVGVAFGVGALHFRKTVERPGGDGGAIVVQRPASVGRSACVGRRPLRIGRIGRVSWSGNDRRMLEQTGRISVLRPKRGACRQRGYEREK
jgi:hypothetical protein